MDEQNHAHVWTSVATGAHDGTLIRRCDCGHTEPVPAEQPNDNEA
jgi:hypothetical protein